MVDDDKTLEAMLYRYKLGLDDVLASRDANDPFHLRPSWRERFFFGLGKQLIVLGSRLQRRAATSAAYHPAYPAS